MKASLGFRDGLPTQWADKEFASPRGANTVFDVGAAGKIDRGTHAPIPIFGHFRNLRDRPARETVTARLLGDPAPDRPRPQDEPSLASRICTESGPVLLTFRELEAAKKLQSEGIADHG